MPAVETNSYVDKSANEYWANDEVWVKGIWDFSEDGGATTDTYNLFKLPAGYIIVDGYAHVTTAVTSAGAATLEVGYTGETAALIAQTAKASLTEDAVINFEGKQRVGTNNTFYVTVGTAAATAGVVEVWVKIKKGN